MRTVGPLFVVLTLVALVSPWAPAVLCARPGAAPMPCCKTLEPCDLQMKTSRCCSIERAPVVPAGTGQIPATNLRSNPVRQIQVAVLDPATLEAGAMLSHPGRERLWYPPAHDRSPSLFLRNASILR